jgi:RNA processing factor Prp31
MLSNIKLFQSIGDLSKTKRYKQHLEKVENALYGNSKDSLANQSTPGYGMEYNAEYQLILESNEIIQEIDEEIVTTTRFIAEIYKLKFPELESLIPNRIDYIKVVQRIGNEMDLTKLNLSDLLSSQLVMIVSVSSSTTSGKPLTDKQLNECLSACVEVLQLHKDKSLILQFIESRIAKIAPNLCALIGSQLTAQLIGIAGGLIPLSKIASCNVSLLGQQKGGNVTGLSTLANRPHQGILIQSDLLRDLPSAFKKKGLKVVGNKVALAARIDAFQYDKSVNVEQDGMGYHEDESSGGEEEEGDEDDEMEEEDGDEDKDDEGEDEGQEQDNNNKNTDKSNTNLKKRKRKIKTYELDPSQALQGIKLRQQIINWLEKIQEPSKSRTHKALPVPEEKKKPRRGGKRVRKMKERYEMTEIRKQQNRMTMTLDTGEYGDSAMGFDQGMVNVNQDTGRVRAAKKVQSKFTSKKLRAVSAASSGTTGGMSSSLAFTPVQGLELVNPNAAADRVKEANKKWFDAHSGFLSAMPK